MIVQAAEFVPTDGLVITRPLKRNWRFLSVQPGLAPGTVRVVYMHDANQAAMKMMQLTVHKTGTEFTRGGKSYLGSSGDWHLFIEPV